MLLAGGIDFSVGSNFALCNFIAIALVNYFQLPVLPVVFPVVILVGALVGLVNGVLVGYLRLRAFLTTLVTLIFVRAIVDLLTLKYAIAISTSTQRIRGLGLHRRRHVAGVPIDFCGAGRRCNRSCLSHAAALRLAPVRGRRLPALGPQCRHLGAAHVSVDLCIRARSPPAARVFYAARLNNAGGKTGVGLEIIVLTAAVLGGNSLGGGRGSVVKALLGAIIVLLITNGSDPARLEERRRLVGAGPHIAARRRHRRALAEEPDQGSPQDLCLAGLFRVAAMPFDAAGLGSPYAQNDKFSASTDRPRRDRRSGGHHPRSRRQSLLRQPARRHHSVLPAGLHANGTLCPYRRHDARHGLRQATATSSSASRGMGLFTVTRTREVIKVTDETNRSFWSIIDDSRMRLADDLDIAPDGRIFFSEATIRYDIRLDDGSAGKPRQRPHHLLRSAQQDVPHGHLRNLMFPNGICVTHDGQSILFAETWGCRISRYWFDGPKKGNGGPVIPTFPAYPDNINRASDGNYLVRHRRHARAGARSGPADAGFPAPDGLARRAGRMVVPANEYRLRVQVRPAGRNLGCLWDLDGLNHPMITSMREHKGYLYLGGLQQSASDNTRFLAPIPNWTGPKSYWGASDVRRSVARVRSLRGSGDAAVTVPPMDGAFSPNQALDKRRRLAIAAARQSRLRRPTHVVFQRERAVRT